MRKKKRFTLLKAYGRSEKKKKKKEKLEDPFRSPLAKLFGQYYSVAGNVTML